MVAIKELRQRIDSVGNIKQITRAMEMVSTTKLRRFQERAIASRPYAEEIAGLVGNLAGVLGDDVDGLPLFKPGAGERTALLLVSSDRGLCGAYNSNLFVALEAALAEFGEDTVDLFVIGRKGYQYCSKRGLHVERFLVEPPLEAVDFAGARATARTLVDGFLGGSYARVEICFTSFVSMAKYQARCVPFLPISSAAIAGDEDARAGGDILLEPDAATLFGHLVPRYLETRVYSALLESLTSEYASRRMSMKAATDAATDMQDVLRGRYNRVRQESITTELLDIVGGAEALR
ncbi:MAG: ATP synthase F1 subunit gamma [Planctomycetes bacterium]|nr:ATP synthase F1 subunit gamma [Planctomycetota bacterium]